VPWFHVGCTEKRCQTEVIIFMWLTTARTAYRHFYGAYVILVCTLHNDWNHTLVAVPIMTYCFDWSTRRLRFFMWRRLIGMYSRLVLRAQHSSKLQWSAGASMQRTAFIRSSLSGTSVAWKWLLQWRCRAQRWAGRSDLAINFWFSRNRSNRLFFTSHFGQAAMDKKDYSVSVLAKFLHSFPHIDLTFQHVNSTFNLANRAYKEVSFCL